MADLEKVLKGLECCCSMTGEACRQCPYDEECAKMVGSGSAHLCANALELLKEQQKQRFFVDSDGKITPLPIQPQWISVEERLPDDASDVLAYYDCGDSGQVIFVNYYKNCWCDAVFNDLIDDLDQGCVTHWMPLPEPPKEVKQNEV